MTSDIFDPATEDPFQAELHISSSSNISSSSSSSSTLEGFRDYNVVFHHLKYVGLVIIPLFGLFFFFCITRNHEEQPRIYMYEGETVATKEELEQQRNTKSFEYLNDGEGDEDEDTSQDEDEGTETKTKTDTEHETSHLAVPSGNDDADDDANDCDCDDHAIQQQMAAAFEQRDGTEKTLVAEVESFEEPPPPVAKDAGEGPVTLTD
eukprot:jgi/Psemu1/303618/fgenesh1_kg.115_\